MNNSPSISIDAPNSYGVNSQVINRQEAAKINEVPNSTNKVKKKVIRGVLKHDTSPSQQG